MYHGTRLIIRRLTALKPTDIIKGSVADNSRGTSTWLDLINLTTDPLIIKKFLFFILFFKAQARIFMNKRTSSIIHE